MFSKQEFVRGHDCDVHRRWACVPHCLSLSPHCAPISIVSFGCKVCRVFGLQSSARNEGCICAPCQHCVYFAPCTHVTPLCVELFFQVLWVNSRVKCHVVAIFFFPWTEFGSSVWCPWTAQGDEVPENFAFLVCTVISLRKRHIYLSDTVLLLLWCRRSICVTVVCVIPNSQVWPTGSVRTLLLTPGLRIRWYLLRDVRRVRIPLTQEGSTLEEMYHGDL